MLAIVLMELTFLVDFRPNLEEFQDFLKYIFLYRSWDPIRRPGQSHPTNSVESLSQKVRL